MTLLYSNSNVVMSNKDRTLNIESICKSCSSSVFNITISVIQF